MEYPSLICFTGTPESTRQAVSKTPANYQRASNTACSSRHSLRRTRRRPARSLRSRCPAGGAGPLLSSTISQRPLSRPGIPQSAATVPSSSQARRTAPPCSTSGRQMRHRHVPTGPCPIVPHVSKKMGLYPFSVPLRCPCRRTGLGAFRSVMRLTSLADICTIMETRYQLSHSRFVAWNPSVLDDCKLRVMR